MAMNCKRFPFYLCQRWNRHEATDEFANWKITWWNRHRRMSWKRERKKKNVEIKNEKKKIEFQLCMTSTMSWIGSQLFFVVSSVFWLFDDKMKHAARTKLSVKHFTFDRSTTTIQQTRYTLLKRNNLFSWSQSSETYWSFSTEQQNELNLLPNYQIHHFRFVSFDENWFFFVLFVFFVLSFCFCNFSIDFWVFFVLCIETGCRNYTQLDGWRIADRSFACLARCYTSFVGRLHVHGSEYWRKRDKQSSNTSCSM